MNDIHCRVYLYNRVVWNGTYHPAPDCAASRSSISNVAFLGAMMQLRGSPLTQRLLFWLDEFQWLCLHIWRLRVRVFGLIDFHYTFHQLVADIEREMTTFLCSECGKSFREEPTLSIHQSRTHDKTS